MMKRCNEYRLSGQPIDARTESRVRELLRGVGNPLASAGVIDLWSDPDNVRAFRADGRPFSLNRESKQLGLRTLDRMRWSVWGDIKHFRDRAFEQGPANSALSGIELSPDSCQVDHHPRKFRHIAEDYLMMMSHIGAPSPDCWSDWDDWVEWHREAVGWSGGEATGLRLLTPEENNRLG